MSADREKDIPCLGICLVTTPWLLPAPLDPPSYPPWANPQGLGNPPVPGLTPQVPNYFRWVFWAELLTNSLFSIKTFEKNHPDPDHPPDHPPDHQSY